MILRGDERNISEDFPKLFRRQDERSPTFSENFRKLLIEDFRGRPEDVSIIHQRILVKSSISSLVRIRKIRHSSPGCSFVWILRAVHFPVKHSCLYNFRVKRRLLFICSRILIGSCLWSIRGQTHDWRHVFPLCFKTAESFEYINNILGHWAKDIVQKRLVEALNKYEKQWGEEGSVSFLWVARGRGARAVGRD